MKEEGGKDHSELDCFEDITALVKFVDWQKVFELHKLFNLHNHEMINYSTLQTVNHPLTEFLTSN